MIETKKYRKENIQIEHLFHPPTEVFKPWFTTLSFYLEDNINQKARTLTGDGTTCLQLGSEIELKIFANKFDQDFHDGIADNPNYTLKHRKNTDQIAEDLCCMRENGGLQEMLYESNAWEVTPTRRRISKDTVFMELRTIPTTVTGYRDQMEELGEWMRAEACARSVRPVVHSQHIHFSLLGKKENPFGKKSRARKFVDKGIVDIYHRALPLVRMPEEIEFLGQKYTEYSSYNVKTKITGQTSPRQRIEARVNNSEYTFDPYLNLVVQLLGIERGLSYSDRIFGYRKIDKDFPLDSRNGPGFSLGNTSFDQRVNHLREDHVIKKYFPNEVVQALADVIQMYKDVSEGKITVAELKGIADAKAYELDPDMYVFGKGK
jgi:hypothetical protein